MTKSISDIINSKKQKIDDKRTGSKRPYKFKNGTTTIRILPTWRPADHEEPAFFASFGQSFIKDSDGKTLAVIGARNIAYGEDDPVQALISQAMNHAKSESEFEHWKEAKAKPRELVNALVLDDKEVDPTEPQIVDLSISQLEAIFEQLRLADIVEEFLDLEKGFNLKVVKSGSGKNGTKYTFAFERKASAVDTDVMERLIDLDAYVRAQMDGTDRAIAAIKSIQNERGAMQVEDKSVSYSGSADVVDGSYTVLDEANESGDALPWVENEKEVVSDEKINELFGDD